ncbi:hypothetical protein [Methylobacterium sp. E-046]|uniref:hypothetical protein n=1 Tax=Methylobacterium sp. E-046 TaxID=2836576 RepID=UPI001FBADF1D|nr:hypothetical protein [Methylobacterium sp. E-046]MCJ2102132.1 hypothetical protein [Methylobacterium sp. E-046]
MSDVALLVIDVQESFRRRPFWTDADVPLLAARAGLLDGYAGTTHEARCARLAAPRARVPGNCESAPLTDAALPPVTPPRSSRGNPDHRSRRPGEGGTSRARERPCPIRDPLDPRGCDPRGCP